MKRNCPECKQATLMVPVTGASFICFQCMSRFKQGWYWYIVSALIGYVVAYSTLELFNYTHNELLFSASCFATYFLSIFGRCIKLDLSSRLKLITNNYGFKPNI